MAGLQPADWSPAARRDLLVGYIGFPFWDVLTFTITNWRDLGEFNEIRIDRISPEDAVAIRRSEEHTSELQSLMRTSYAVFCLKKKTIHDARTKIETNIDSQQRCS